MKMRTAGLALLTLFGLAGVVGAAQAPWTDNFEAAKTRAAKEGKDLLIDFTGSDWCGWCIRLKREVFDTDTFKTAATRDFVLVELDFPKRTAQDPQIQQQNQKLQAEFEVRGFPSIFLADLTGKPYARTGYRAGGAKAYLQHLAGLRESEIKAQRLLADAQGAQGLEKARMLDEFLTLQEGMGTADPERAKIVEQIIALDAQNSAGLRGKYQVRQNLEAAQAAIQVNDVDRSLAALEEAIANSSGTPADRQMAWFMKGMILAQAKGDRNGALAALEAAQKAAPDSPAAGRIASTIQQMKQPVGSQ